MGSGGFAGRLCIQHLLILKVCVVCYVDIVIKRSFAYLAYHLEPVLTIDKTWTTTSNFWLDIMGSFNTVETVLVRYLANWTGTGHKWKMPNNFSLKRFLATLKSHSRTLLARINCSWMINNVNYNMLSIHFNKLATQCKYYWSNVRYHLCVYDPSALR